jgi:hypothetical protein
MKFYHFMSSFVIIIFQVIIGYRLPPTSVESPNTSRTRQPAYVRSIGTCSFRYFDHFKQPFLIYDKCCWFLSNNGVKENGQNSYGRTV